jgi:cyclic pyranopterin phosphate synthase
VRTRSLEAHVVDHCNLTCAECCSLSPLLPAWSAEPADLERDLAHAARVLAPSVFKLVGGEPLLHPLLLDLVGIARRSAIAPRISVTTNGLLLGRMSDALFDAIDALTISLYPAPALAADAIAAIEERASRFRVTLNWKHQAQFVVMDRPTRCDDAVEVGAVYHDCWLRERCHILRDGRFYACTRPPHFQTYHRGALDFTADGLALEDGMTPESVVAYLLRERPLEACAHCFGGSAAMVPHRLLSRTELVRARR